MSDLPDDMDPVDGLAADFALGALDREAHREAERSIARDPAFRAAVEGWQALLSPLAEGVAEVAPPPAVWERISAGIAPVAPNVAATSLGSPRASRAPFWSSLALWRGLAGGAVAFAAVAVAMLVARPQPAVQPLLVATLAAPDGAALLTATYDASRGAVILTPADKSKDDGRTPELWVIEDGSPPRSLGTIDVSVPGSHAIPPERLKGLKAGSTLAISLEPKGGSPTGAPTGPVVATGKLTGI